MTTSGPALSGPVHSPVPAEPARSTRRPGRAALTAAAGYVALSVADTLLAGSASPARRRLRVVTKPLLMPALGTAFALTAGDGGGTLRGATVTAQALSGVGDIALLSKSEPAFLAGLSSFFGAHVAYTAGFASSARAWTDPTHRGGLVAGAAIAATAGPVMGWAAGRQSEQLKGPVIAYAGILAAMTAASTRLSDDVPLTARRTTVAGTALFLLSDTILATRKFLMPHAGPRSDAAVMATYTAGQGLIAAGVARAVRAGSAL